MLSIILLERLVFLFLVPLLVTFRAFETRFSGLKLCMKERILSLSTLVSVSFECLRFLEADTDFTDLGIVMFQMFAIKIVVIIVMSI